MLIDDDRNSRQLNSIDVPLLIEFYHVDLRMY
jgi:hypothetical protein